MKSSTEVRPPQCVAAPPLESQIVGSTWLGSSLTPELKKRWTDLQAQGKFHPDVARKTLALDEHYVRGISHRSMQDLRSDLINHPSIGSIAHYRGPEKLMGLIMLVMEPFLSTISVGKGFGTGGAAEGRVFAFFTEMMTIKFPRVTLCDLRFAMIENMGDTLYDRLDANIVFGWLATHMDQRLTFSGQQAHLEHEKLKKEPGEKVTIPLAVKEKFNALEKKLDSDRRKNISKTTPNQYYSLYHYARLHDLDPIDLHAEIIKSGDEEWKENKRLYNNNAFSRKQFDTFFVRRWLVKRSREV